MADQLEFCDIQCLIICLNSPISSSKLYEAVTNNDGQSHETLTKEPLLTQWLVSNKYFTANVKTCFCMRDQFVNFKTKDFKSLEALVIVSDLNDNSSFTDVKNITSGVNLKNTDLCLLLSTEEKCSNGCYKTDLVSVIRGHHVYMSIWSSTKENLRDEVFSWSIENKFEFVESTSDNQDEDDGFEEKFGIDRILEALNSHVWSNHIRTDEQTVPNMPSISDGASFEEKFGKFEEMKEKAKDLQGDARKEYAGQVALAFMEALGISDDDEEKT